mmetsp:Transcript_68074/g.179372  ORF Transcript_68074/g.179372 Transcript_68074/m.179372 type:complete len:218 (+) Transcript_68074:458-1111(+)
MLIQSGATGEVSRGLAAIEADGPKLHSPRLVDAQDRGRTIHHAVVSQVTGGFVDANVGLGSEHESPAICHGGRALVGVDVRIYPRLRVDLCKVAVGGVAVAAQQHTIDNGKESVEADGQTPQALSLGERAEGEGADGHQADDVDYIRVPEADRSAERNRQEERADADDHADREGLKGGPDGGGGLVCAGWNHCPVVVRPCRPHCRYIPEALMVGPPA